MMRTGLIGALFSLFVTPVGAQTQTDVAGRTIVVNVGKAEVLSLRRDAADVLVSNAAVADVQLPATRRMYILGRSVGTASVFVFDREGEVIHKLELEVAIDDQALQRALTRIAPGERVQVTTLNRDVLLTGSVSSPSVAERVRMVARRFVGEDTNVVDMMTVRGDYQVLMQIKVYEVKRELLKELGFNTEAFGSDGNFRGQIDTNGGTGFTSGTPFTSPGTAPLTGTNPITGTALQYVVGAQSLLIGLNALQLTGESRLLAEPNLTAISGERAVFHAGSEIFVSVGETEDGVVQFEPRDLGVKVTFEPLVLDSDRLRLHLATEVSDLSDENLPTGQVVAFQGRNLRRAETTVEMKSGGTLMIAGLLQSELVDRQSGLPVASDIPLINKVGANEAYQVIETELLVLVTAILVRPYSDNQLAQPVNQPRDSALSLPRPTAPIAADGLMRYQPPGEIRPDDAGPSATAPLPEVSAVPLEPPALPPEAPSAPRLQPTAASTQRPARSLGAGLIID